MTPTTVAWESETVHVAGIALHLTRGGAGAPLLLLPHDVGRPERLASPSAAPPQPFPVLRPSHPGYDRSARPDWMRGVRDVAVVYQALLAGREATREPGRGTVVGLGCGGWLAAGV